MTLDILQFIVGEDQLTGFEWRNTYKNTMGKDLTKWKYTFQLHTEKVGKYLEYEIQICSRKLWSYIKYKRSKIYSEGSTTSA